MFWEGPGRLWLHRASVMTHSPTAVWTSPPWLNVTRWPVWMAATCTPTHTESLFQVVPVKATTVYPVTQARTLGVSLDTRFLIVPQIHSFYRVCGLYFLLVTQCHHSSAPITNSVAPCSSPLWHLSWWWFACELWEGRNHGCLFIEMSLEPRTVPGTQESLLNNWINEGMNEQMQFWVRMVLERNREPPSRARSPLTNGCSCPRWEERRSSGMVGEPPQPLQHIHRAQVPLRPRGWWETASPPVCCSLGVFSTL